MTQARNEHPLHDHRGVNAGPWTQDTMLAHLRQLHGVDQLPDDAPLAELARKHDELNHGASWDEKIFAEALAPERRYKSITLGTAKWGHPGDLALHFEDANGNGTNIVNLRPGDMPLARAALIPADPALKDISGQATAALGPGARKYVQQAHARGYSTGVGDMEAIHATMTEAERVCDWLAGFYESAVISDWLTGEDVTAISKVRELIQRRMDGQAAPEARP
jgi:hypothetical protein